MVHDRGVHSESEDRQVDRLLRIQQLIDACIDRRLRGEEVADAQIVTEHPELMPELADELRHLAVIERARRRASGSSQLDALEGPVGSDAALAADLFPGCDIIEEIHRGGQGVVYRALQRSTRRAVALKVIREGAFATPRELARFQREIDILASLQHPGIVRVYDSGVTAGGSFYYLMDLVPGPPIDVHVRQLNPGGMPPIDAVLTLFLKICDAVQAAHLSGVIHRDLKPSNIRVDAAGAPYVLDFGLAKRQGETNPGQSPAPDMTETGQFVGSIPWASPEQAAGAGTIDLRTDIYALGLLLYHLLTDGFPYEITGHPREVLRSIEHSVPVRPRSLRRGISDELETIIMRCLAKEPDRRYDSAGALARDLRRMQAGEPIAAKRDSAWYILRKAVQRHRIAGAVALLLAFIVTGSAIWLASLYAGQRAERLRAEDAARAAQQAAQRAETVSDLLQGMIAAADPYHAKGPGYTVREQLDAFANTLPEHDIADPEVAADVYTAVGKAYRGLGETGPAMTYLGKALELRRAAHVEPHEDLALSINEYGLVHRAAGDFVAAEPLVRESADMYRRVLGPDATETLKTTNNLATVLHILGRYDEAEDLFAEVVERERARADQPTPELAEYLSNQAAMRRDLGDYAAAEEACAEALAIVRKVHGENHAAVARHYEMMGGILAAAGRLDEALTWQREALERQRTWFGDDHFSLGNMLNSLAQTEAALGSVDVAIAHNREALAIFRKLHLQPHPDLAAAINNLAGLLMQQGDIAGAAPLVEEAVEQIRAVYGPTNVNTGAGLTTLANLRIEQGRYTEAEEHTRAALAIFRAALGDDHPNVIILLNNLGRCLSLQDDDAGAAELFREALAKADRVLPPDHPYLGTLLNHLAEALKFAGDYAAAEPLYVQALAFRQRTMGADHRQVAYTLNGFGDLYLEMRDFPAAEQRYREALAISTNALPPDHRDQAIPLVNLGRALVEQNRAVEAEPYLRRGRAIRVATRAADHAYVGNAHHWLGACLNRQQRYAEAEPLLVEALRIRTADTSEKPAARVATMIELARAWLGLERFPNAEALLLDAYDIARADTQTSDRLLHAIVDALLELDTRAFPMDRAMRHGVLPAK